MGGFRVETEPSRVQTLSRFHDAAAIFGCRSGFSFFRMTTKDIDGQQNEMVEFQGFLQLNRDQTIYRQKKATISLSN
jgi:hypothetical protein